MMDLQKEEETQSKSEYRRTQIQRVMKAFTDYLGIALADMDDIGKNLYSPDYEIFEAGWLACLRASLEKPAEDCGDAEDVVRKIREGEYGFNIRVGDLYEEEECIELIHQFASTYHAKQCAECETQQISMALKDAWS